MQHMFCANVDHHQSCKQNHKTNISINYQVSDIKQIQDEYNNHVNIEFDNNDDDDNHN